MPPCTRLVFFEERAAVIHDRNENCPCGFPPEDHRFGIFASRVKNMTQQEMPPSTTIPLWCVGDAAVEMGTDDPDEAQAAFAKGAEWVRTGEMA